jgi:hypothetical protein
MYNFSPNVKRKLHKRNEDWIEERKKQRGRTQDQEMTRKEIVETSASEQLFESLDH